MRIALLELRRSSLKWAAPVVTIAAIVAMVSLEDVWLGSWPSTTSHSAGSTATYGMVLFAALAALDTARQVRAVPAALVLSKKRFAPVIVQLAAAIIWSLVPMVVVLAAAAAWNLSEAPAGLPWVSFILYAAAVQTAAVGAGALVGYAAPSVPIATLAGAAAGFVAMAYGDIPLGAPVNLSLNPVRIILVLVIALGAASAVVVLGRWGTKTTQHARSRAVRTAAGVSVVTILAAAVTAPASGSIRELRPYPEQPVCTEGSPRVCVWPEHAAFLPTIAELAARVAQTADGVLDVPSVFYEHGSMPPLNPWPTGFSWIGRGDGGWHVAEGLAIAVWNENWMPRGCFPDQQEDITRASEILDQIVHWLAVSSFGADRPDTFQGGFRAVDEARQVLTLDSESQRAWARELMDEALDLPCVP